MPQVEILQEGGFLILPLVMLSVLAGALFFERIWALQRNRIVPSGFLRALLALLKESDTTQATRLTHENDSALARIARDALLMQGKPRALIKERMGEHGEAEMGLLERRIGALGTIATIAPLMGLLGTITGMIQVFRQISTEIDPAVSALAGGIWEALLTTAAGLVVAIPTYAATQYLQSVVDQRSQELADASYQVLELLAAPDESGDSQ